MSTRTLLFGWASAALLTVTLSACDSGKTDDTATDTESDTDTDTDTDADTDADPNYLEPNFLIFDFQAIVSGGELNLTSKYQNYFAVQYIDGNSWDGDINSPYNHCSIIISLDNATVDTNMIAAGATYGGWNIPAGSPAEGVGECDNLDPLVWGSDVVGDIAALSWGFGFSPASGEFDENVSKEILGKYVDAWIDTSGLGATDPYNKLNIAVVYDEGTQQAKDISGEPVLPDGIYGGYALLGYSLQ